VLLPIPDNINRKILDPAVFPDYSDVKGSSAIFRALLMAVVICLW